MRISKEDQESKPSRGIKLYLRPEEELTLEEKLTKNLRELAENPDAEILPITAGYLAHQQGPEAFSAHMRAVRKVGEAADSVENEQ